MGWKYILVLLFLVFPDYEYLRVFKEKFNLLTQFNVRKSIEYFKNGIYIYKEQIVNRNEDFFIKRNYNEDIKDLQYDSQYDSQWSLDQVLNLKDLWSKLDDENKNIIWIYFNVLIKIVELEYKL